MLIVNAPLMTDRVRAVLDGYDKDGVTIRFVSREGMKLSFEMTGLAGYDAVDFVKKAQKKGELTEDDQKKAEFVKKLIRSHDFGNALYFQVAWH